VGSVEANNTTFVDSGLESETTYYYQIRAIGPTGESAPNVGSVTGNGLDYSYYEINNLSRLPDFDSYTAKTTGNLDNVTLSVRQRNDNFALQFEGFIDIPVAGEYTFYTRSDDGSKLYIDDEVVVNNDGLHGDQTRSGVKQFDAAGFYAIKIEFFEKGGGESLTVEYQGPGISRQQIPNSAFKAVEYINATTLDLPPLPSAPANVTVSGVSTSEIEIAWSDASNNETGFDIFRAADGSSDFDLIGNVEANTESYLDSDLPAHTQYRYQVAAKGIQDQVSLSQIVEGSSLNTDPVIDPMTDVVMRINSNLQVSITASDVDLDEVGLSVVQKPDFVTTVQNSSGLLVLSLSPTELGAYTVELLAEDNFGGSTSLSFDITVNENYLPVITPISNITIEENTSYTVNISSSDFDENDDLTYSTGDLPTFANFSDNGDGTATLALNPDYTNSGIYPIEISVTDGKSTVSES
ncbi:MAG: PA14 domain-containing protein, partial [Bacteroidota bacterium]